MFRTISLVKRKPGLTPRQFRDYFESTHRVLGEKAINGFGLAYDRYYLAPMPGESAEPVCDAVVHMCFPDRAAFARCTAAVENDPATAKLFAQDDLNCIDRANTTRFAAEDSFSRLDPVPASDTIFRTVWFARHRPDMTHEQCRAYYERKHRLVGEYLVNGTAYCYDRHFLSAIAPGAPEPYYTFVMEMNFPSADHFMQMGAGIMADPTLSRFIAEDEARFIDRDSAVHYMAALCTSALEVPAAAA